MAKSESQPTSTDPSFTQLSYERPGGAAYRIHDDDRVEIRDTKTAFQYRTPTEVEKKQLLMWLENLIEIVKK